MAKNRSTAVNFAHVKGIPGRKKLSTPIHIGLHQWPLIIPTSPLMLPPREYRLLRAVERNVTKHLEDIRHRFCTPFYKLKV